MKKYNIPNQWRDRVKDNPLKNKILNEFDDFLVADFKGKFGKVHNKPQSIDIAYYYNKKVLVINHNIEWTHWMPVSKKNDKDPLVLITLLSSIIYSMDNLLTGNQRKIIYKSIRLMKSLKKFGINYEQANKQIGTTEDTE